MTTAKDTAAPVRETRRKGPLRRLDRDAQGRRVLLPHREEVEPCGHRGQDRRPGERVRGESRDLARRGVGEAPHHPEEHRPSGFSRRHREGGEEEGREERIGDQAREQEALQVQTPAARARAATPAEAAAAPRKAAAGGHESEAPSSSAAHAPRLAAPPEFEEKGIGQRVLRRACGRRPPAPGNRPQSRQEHARQAQGRQHRAVCPASPLRIADPKRRCTPPTAKAEGADRERAGESPRQSARAPDRRHPLHGIASASSSSISKARAPGASGPIVRNTTRARETVPARAGPSAKARS